MTDPREPVGAETAEADYALSGPENEQAPSEERDLLAKITASVLFASRSDSSRTRTSGS